MKKIRLKRCPNKKCNCHETIETYKNHCNNTHDITECPKLIIFMSKKK